MDAYLTEDACTWLQSDMPEGFDPEFPPGAVVPPVMLKIVWDGNELKHYFVEDGE